MDEDLAAPPGAGGRHPLPAPRTSPRAASRAGIGEGVFVVAYGNMGGAERLWWLLRHFGHDDCAVLELDGWLGPLRAGEEQIEPAEFVPRERDGRHDRAGRARAAPRRAGGRRRPPARALPRRAEPDRQDPGPDPRSPQRALGRAAPELPAGELVAYCGSGVTACVALHRLFLGGREGRLYPGSWSEWEQLGLPVTRG